MHPRWTTPIHCRPCTPPGRPWVKSPTRCRGMQPWKPCCSTPCSIFRHGCFRANASWTSMSAHPASSVTRIAAQQRHPGAAPRAPIALSLTC
ncbi:hypothetical protein XAC3810_430173 [Xanthomonas citri pv. citri]|uniref:Uncharacterized protein n=1 Tax=Xanthomonas citri pv. citri TaxID=611301 RepID=A0A0U5FEH3_XANCI|nr:hypothetical protein XAC9322_430198 [Xanthomonas citri pv. citri]CEE27838.1 hypothetical protein XAC3824_520011 [Xanthomonas citri pv. citri]CEE29388.1 hypothetical protein XAC1083_430197 [Xanthomonas citri pv. citri]CEE38503.1 hypothetical protein XAC3810_430173 [Xanthomonas citri pv. citri]CEE40396.1 hypothetical protein XAC902_570030 [Xanthomonas citri pv. citri]